MSGMRPVTGRLQIPEIAVGGLFDINSRVNIARSLFGKHGLRHGNDLSNATHLDPRSLA